MLFPNFKNTLLDFSSKLDRQPKLLALPLLLGIDFAGLSKTNSLDQWLISIGFSLESQGLWKRDDECYENHFSPSKYGYLSLGEINEWCQLLRQRCIDNKVSLFLALGEEMMSYELEPVKQAIDGLMGLFINLNVVYNPLAQPKDQAALLVALDILEWPYAWILLFEDMFFRQALTAHFIADAVQAINDQLDLDSIKLIIRKIEQKEKQHVVYGDIATKEAALKRLIFLLENYR